MLTKKPYKVSPYKEMVKLKCPWIADVKARVKKRIAEFEQFIKDEAAADHLTKMADADYVYDCFKYNLEHNIKFGMLQVLKYFSLRFRIKILYDMIGEWKFTDHDKEIYEHFRNTSYADIKESTITRKLSTLSGKMPNIFVHDNTCMWLVHFGDEKEFYSNFFYKEIVMLIDITRNAKCLELVMPERSFFDGGHLHEGLNLSKPLDFEEYNAITFG